MWGFKAKARQTFEFPELEKKLKEVRADAKEESEKLNRKASRVLYRKEVHGKMKFIRKRNKIRSILVVGEDGINSPIVLRLLEANSNAEATFARTMQEAVGMLKQQTYGMIYIVTDIRTGPDCSGPCFFSMDEDDYAQGYGHIVESELSTLGPHYNGHTEVVVVCSGKRCPVEENFLGDR